MSAAVALGAMIAISMMRVISSIATLVTGKRDAPTTGVQG